MKKKLFIVDGHNLIYRMFYAVQDLRSQDGRPVGAIFGTIKTFLGWHQIEKPDYLVVALDAPGGSWRDEVYVEYKAHRDATPSELRTQEGVIFEFLQASGIAFIQKQGWEADDIIGTLVKEVGEKNDLDTYIISSDKDLYQFVGEYVAVYDPMKKKTSRAAEAQEKFGVPALFVADYLALMGDASDNIPGVAGIGPKWAAELINTFGGIEAIYGALLENRVPEKYAKKLRENERNAWLSKKLATIDVAVPLGAFHLDHCLFQEKNILTEKVIDILEEFGFQSLLPKEKKETPKIDFSSLKKIHVVSQEGLANLWEKIRQKQKTTISTWGRDIELDGVAFAFDDNEVWGIDCNKIDCTAFFNTLLPSDGVISGWDLKNDLRRILFYLKHHRA